MSELLDALQAQSAALRGTTTSFAPSPETQDTGNLQEKLRMQSASLRGEQVQQAPEPVEQKGILGHMANRFAHGVVDVPAAFGSMTRAAGALGGIDPLEDAGERMKIAVEQYRTANVDPMQRPEGFVTRFAGDVAGMIPGIVASLIPGGAVGRAVGIASKAPRAKAMLDIAMKNNFKRGITKYATAVERARKKQMWGSIFASSLAGGGLEGAGTFEDSLQRGATTEVAAEAAFKQMGAVALLGMPFFGNYFSKGFFAPGKNKLLNWTKKAGTGGVLEAIQEMSEEYTEIGAQLTSDVPFAKTIQEANEGALHVMGPSFFVGALFGGAGAGSLEPGEFVDNALKSADEFARIKGAGDMQALLDEAQEDKFEFEKSTLGNQALQYDKKVEDNAREAIALSRAIQSHAQTVEQGPITDTELLKQKTIEFDNMAKEQHANKESLREEYNNEKQPDMKDARKEKLRKAERAYQSILLAQESHLLTLEALELDSNTEGLTMTAYKEKHAEMNKKLREGEAAMKKNDRNWRTGVRQKTKLDKETEARQEAEYRKGEKAMEENTQNTRKTLRVRKELQQAANAMDALTERTEGVAADVQRRIDNLKANTELAIINAYMKFSTFTGKNAPQSRTDKHNAFLAKVDNSIEKVEEKIALVEQNIDYMGQEETQFRTEEQQDAAIDKLNKELEKLRKVRKYGERLYANEMSEFINDEITPIEDHHAEAAESEGATRGPRTRAHKEATKPEVPEELLTPTRRSAVGRQIKPTKKPVPRQRIVEGLMKQQGISEQEANNIVDNGGFSQNELRAMAFPSTTRDKVSGKATGGYKQVSDHTRMLSEYYGRIDMIRRLYDYMHMLNEELTGGLNEEGNLQIAGVLEEVSGTIKKLKELNEKLVIENRHIEKLAGTEVIIEDTTYTIGPESNEDVELADIGTEKDNRSSAQAKLLRAFKIAFKSRTTKFLQDDEVAENILRQIATQEIRIDVGIAMILEHKGVIDHWLINEHGTLEWRLNATNSVSQDQAAIKLFYTMIKRITPIMEKHYQVSFRQNITDISEVSQMTRDQFHNDFMNTLKQKDSALHRMYLKLKDFHEKNPDAAMNHDETMLALRIMWARALNASVRLGVSPDQFMEDHFVQQTGRGSFFLKVDDEVRTRSGQKVKGLFRRDRPKGTRGTIHIDKDTDLKTFIHEIAHWFRTDLGNTQIEKQIISYLEPLWKMHDYSRTKGLTKRKRPKDKDFTWDVTAEELFVDTVLHYFDAPMNTSVPGTPTALKDEMDMFSDWLKNTSTPTGLRYALGEDIQSALNQLFYVPLRMAPKGKMIDQMVRAKSGKYKANPALFVQPGDLDFKLIGETIDVKNPETTMTDDELTEAALALVEDYKSRVGMDSPNVWELAYRLAADEMGAILAQDDTPGAVKTVAFGMLGDMMILNTKGIFKTAKNATDYHILQSHYRTLNANIASAHGHALRAHQYNRSHSSYISNLAMLENTTHKAHRRELASLVFRMQRDPGNINHIREFADLVEQNENSPTFMNVMVNLMYGGMLSNPVTWLTNIINNGAMTIYNEAVHKPVAIMMDTAISTVLRKPRTIYAAEALALPTLLSTSHGYNQIAKAWKEAASIVFTGQGTTNHEESKVENELTKRELEAIKHLRRVPLWGDKGIEISEQMASKLALTLTFGARINRGMDVFFSHLSTTMALQSLSYNRAMKALEAGEISKSQFENYRESLMIKPSQDLIDDAEQVARRNIFTDRLGEFGTALSTFRRSNPTATLMMPFHATLTNIIKRSLELMPGGAVGLSIATGGTLTPLLVGAGAMAIPGQGLQAMYQLNKKKKTVSKDAKEAVRLPYKVDSVAEYAAKWAEGAALAYALMTLFQPSDEDPLPQLTGKWPKDPAEGANWSALGIQPYSIRMFDRYISYDRLEPFGALFSSVARGYDALQDLKEIEGNPNVDLTEAQVEVLTTTGRDLMAYMLQNSFASRLLEMGQLSNTRSTEGASRFFGHIVGSFVPLSGMLRWTERLAAARGTGDLEKRVRIDGVIPNFLHAVVPGSRNFQQMFLDTEGQEFEYSAYGEMKTINTRNYWNLWSPLPITNEIENDPIEMTLFGMEYYPVAPYADRKIEFKGRNADRWYHIPNDLYDSFIIEYGTDLKANLSRVIETGAFQKLNPNNYDEQQKRMELLKQRTAKVGERHRKKLRSLMLRRIRNGEIRPMNPDAVLQVGE